MHAVANRDDLLERRQVTTDQVTDCWDDLTLAQKFSASSLNQFGYELAFIRDYNSGSIAVLICDGKIATISTVGEINTSPAITLRS